MSSLRTLRALFAGPFLAICLAMALWSQGPGWQDRVAADVRSRALAVAGIAAGDICGTTAHAHTDCPFCRLLDDGGRARRPLPRILSLAVACRIVAMPSAPALRPLRARPDPRAPPLA